MSDEEDYDSEEDADYVPSEGELGSEEEHSGDDEDLSVLADDAGTASETRSKKSRRKKENKTVVAPRKRRGGIKLDGQEDAASSGANGDTDENKELAPKLKEEAEAKRGEKEKKRADDLWASFMSEVKPHVQSMAKTTQPPTSTMKTSGCSPASAQKPAAAQPSSSAIGSARTASEKITITTIFDFAGEEVRVTKQVDANSKEAQEELKKQEQQQQEEEENCVRATSSSSQSNSSSSPSSILGGKRSAAAAGGLGGVLSKIGKKQKLGTLEKSQMDWTNFKRKEGIEEDLKIHNKGKDGYIERMAFLSRTDVRQYEIERDLRLSKSGKR